MNLDQLFQEELSINKTAADQFDAILLKMSAAIDGSDLMNKKNPVGPTQSGTDAGSVDEGLRRLEADKHGREVAEKTSPEKTMQSRKLEQSVIDPAIMTPEAGSYPLRPSEGVPKVGAARWRSLARGWGGPKFRKAVGAELYDPSKWENLRAQVMRGRRKGLTISNRGPDSGPGTVARIQALKKAHPELAEDLIRLRFKKTKTSSLVDAPQFSAEKGSYPLRPTDGVPKVGASKKEEYVNRVGREGFRRGALLGAGGGALSGGLVGARAGAKRTGSAKGAITGALLGALGGGATVGTVGGLGLRALSRHSAGKLKPAQRAAAERFNKAHEQYRKGTLARKRYGEETNRFLRSAGVTKKSSAVELMQKLAAEGKVRTLENWNTKTSALIKCTACGKMTKTSELGKCSECGALHKTSAAKWRKIIHAVRGVQERGGRVPHELGRAARNLEEAGLQTSGRSMSMPGTKVIKEKGLIGRVSKNKEKMRENIEGLRMLAKEYPSRTRWGVENMG